MAEETGASYTCQALREAGVEVIVGLPGTQTIPIDAVIADSEEFRYVMARHETAIPHVAWGYYEASGRPAATLTVPGPGETNAMHGLKNALEDSVPIIHLTGDADPDWLGKKPIHEIDPGTYDPVVKENAVVRSPGELPEAVTATIERALSPPYGPVRLGIPTTFYDHEIDADSPSIEPNTASRNPPSAAIEEAVSLLGSAERPLLIAGGGLSRSPDGVESIRILADRLDAPVLTTFKGKGTFPEDDDRWLGTMGGSMPPGAIEVLERAEVVLAAGTDLDGLCTRNWSLPLGDALVHVDLDPATIGAAYPPTVSLRADAGVALGSIADGLRDFPDHDRWDGSDIGRRVRAEYEERLRELGLLGDGPPLHIPAMLRTVRGAIPDESMVVTDVGGFRVWAFQTFPVQDRSRYLTAGSWAGMGVGLPAAIGAQIARPETPVVCLTGDGGLLMCLQELATAAEEDLPIVMVVANNSDYGIISKRFGREHPRWNPPFGWASPSYPALARAFGWEAASVAERDGLREAIRRALKRDGPTLIDVEIATEEPPPGDVADFESTVRVDAPA